MNSNAHLKKKTIHHKRKTNRRIINKTKTLKTNYQRFINEVLQYKSSISCHLSEKKKPQSFFPEKNRYFFGTAKKGNSLKW